MSTNPDRTIVVDGQHTAEVLTVLEPDLGAAGIKAARVKAAEIIGRSVDPIAGPPPEPSDGLLYGLIQSGKTSILTVSAAMAADNGFDCIVVLTTDNDLLYEQTLDRIRAALRGLTVLGKKDWKDTVRFSRQLRTTPFVIVCSKNGSMLGSLLDAFQHAKSRGLSVFLIDDEADQASLNTLTSKATGQMSRINKVITDFRDYFPVNTYLQVTATPQALFLQRPDHRYRPAFTVVTEPGSGYVGGEAFFGTGRARLLRSVDLAEVNQLRASNQPSPTAAVPKGLRQALDTFLVAAAARIIDRPSDSFAFLCHVSMSTRDHEFIKKLLDAFKEDAINAFKNPSSGKYEGMLKRLREAYADLNTTEMTLPPFDKVVEKIKFYISGANIRLVNATSSEEIKLDAVFNMFVGGNKLGRGVTIKNLLVSYYGRNPRSPNADTVLQHARMYGYREKDLGVTRLFLPDRLANHFTSIHEMEKSLRDLLKKNPDGRFEGLYISGTWSATRRNVLDPSSLGLYVAGESYNPIHPLRTASAKKNTDWLDEALKSEGDAPPYATTTVARALEVLERIEIDPVHGAQLWSLGALSTALGILREQTKSEKVYLVVKRNRDLRAPRGEKRGIISGGEEALAPRDAPTLYMYRSNTTPSGEAAVWWPQLRFPDGNYVLAFSFDW